VLPLVPPSDAAGSSCCWPLPSFSPNISERQQMFTGIVEEVGTVAEVAECGDGRRLRIEAGLVTDDMTPGGSIAVDGCCLTIVDIGDRSWSVDVVPETLSRTTLGLLTVGSRVNLERPLPASGRFDGHIVQGHIDTTADIVASEEITDGSHRVGFALPPDRRRTIVEKGSVTVDGVSLTIAALTAHGFEIAVIPHTWAVTRFNHYNLGDPVNIEFDILAKYVERLLEPRALPVSRLSGIDDALDAYARGEFLVVVDDEDRENEGDLIIAADAVDEKKMAFMIRHTSGVICAPMPDNRADELDLPLMVVANTESMHTAFTVTVDCRHATTTGISAADRVATLHALAHDHTRATDLSRPGHVFPLRAHEGGVLERAGHTEAAVDLGRMSGRSEVGVLGEIVNDNGTMTRLPDLISFAERHALHIIAIADLIRYRQHKETSP
jgi:3,4-dihydroxy 2-butanone 4-phosphate synthase